MSIHKRLILPSAKQGLIAVLALALSALGVWIVAEMLQTGEYQRRGHIYERSSEPFRFWFRAVGLSLGSFFFGCLGVLILFGRLINGPLNRRLDRHLLAKMQRHEPPSTATLLDEDPR